MRFVALAVVLFVRASPSFAEPIWQLDSFSYFHVPSAGITYQMRSNELPLRISPSGVGRWAVRLPRDLVGTRSLQSNSIQASVEMIDDGIGEFVLDGGAMKGTLTLRLRITGSVDGRIINVPVVLSLTTGRAETLVAGQREAIDGVPLDPSSENVQLVAVGTNPAGLGPISGQAFYVALNGRVVDLPSDMR